MHEIVENRLAVEANFEDMTLIEVISHLVELFNTYPNSIFRSDYDINNSSLYLADRREETEHEYIQRLEKEKRNEVFAELSAKRQLKRLKESHPHLFKEE